MTSLEQATVRTRIGVNSGQRAYLTRRVEGGVISPTEGAPQMERLLAEAVALREQALACRAVTARNLKPIRRPEWLLEITSSLAG